MPAAMTPSEMVDRLADAREEMFSLLGDLGTDDLEPAERNEFEHRVCELHAEIEKLIAEIQVLSDLVHSADGLTTPARESGLSKNERSNALRLARTARKMARDVMAKPDDVLAAARKLRDVRACIWSDPVLSECEHLGRVIIALTEQSRSARLAWALQRVSFSGADAMERASSACKASIRAGLTTMSAAQLLEFDKLVQARRIVLRPEIASEHQWSMVRLLRDGKAA